MHTFGHVNNLTEIIDEIDFEEPEDKKIVPIEIFTFRVLQEINGVKYFYNNILIGAIDAVSHKYQIKCKETYKEVFDFISNKLRELGWE